MTVYCTVLDFIFIGIFWTIRCTCCRWGYYESI